MPTINSVLADYAALTTTEQNAVKSALINISGKAGTVDAFVSKERFKDGLLCPMCGGKHVLRNGHNAAGKQRYLCKTCGKTFFSTTNTIASGTRKNFSTWENYINCMMSGLSLRKSAQICGIHYNTAFAWRHKILDALQQMMDSVKLDGIIEADETFFDVSYKGNHSKNPSFVMPRKVHKRGHQSTKRGISNEKVCVPCAVNRDGISVSRITNLGRVSTKDLHKLYDDKVVEGSTFITDKMNSYTRFCHKQNLNLVQLKSGKNVKGIYHIEHINNYHSQLKRFLRPFNGVSTKYLNNYLVWHNLVDYSKEDLFEKRNLMLRFVLSATMDETNAAISNRASIPVR